MSEELETIEAIRQDIVGELEAVSQYERHAANTTNQKAKKVWSDIADEERVHTGELFTLLFELDPVSAEMFMKGQQEAKELLKSLNFRR